jgi:hypothetical protein
MFRNPDEVVEKIGVEWQPNVCESQKELVRPARERIKNLEEKSAKLTFWHNRSSVNVHRSTPISYRALYAYT